MGKQKHWTSYPVWMTYPRTGDSLLFLGFAHVNVTDLESKPVTIGLPGGDGTSERKEKKNS